MCFFIFVNGTKIYTIIRTDDISMCGVFAGEAIVNERKNVFYHKKCILVRERGGGGSRYT